MRFRILERILMQEKEPALRSMIRTWLDQEDHFDTRYEQKIVESLSEQDQKIVRALGSKDLTLLRKVFIHLAKKRRVTFLKTQVNIAKKIQDKTLIRATLRLLAELKEGALDEILVFMQSADNEIVESCCEAMRINPNPRCHEELLRQSVLGKAGIRRIAWRSFSNLDRNRQHSLLFRLREDSHPDHRLLCALAFSHAEYRPGFEREILEVLIGDEDERILQSSWKAIERFAANGISWAQELQKKVRSSSVLQELEKNTRQLYENQKPLHGLEELVQNSKELDPSIPFEIAYANGSSQKKVKLLLPMIEAESERLRANAVEAIAYLKEDLPFEKLFSDSSNRVRANAILAHAQNCPEEDREKRLECLDSLKNGSKTELLSYLFCLKHMDDEGLATIAFSFLSHPIEEVSQRAYDTLEHWAEKSEAIRLRLAEHKRNKNILANDDEPLDEFLE